MPDSPPGIKPEIGHRRAKMELFVIAVFCSGPKLAASLPMKKYISLLLVAMACGLAPLISVGAEQPAAGAFFFRDGDRAMILGDSITEQRQYSALVESFVLSRFPDWKITFRNTGWGGDTMGLRTRKGLDAGFDRDIKPLQPTAVTIDFGMNDARAGEAGVQPYVESARLLAGRFAALGTRAAFITSSPEERFQSGLPAGSGYNLMLRKYSDELHAAAKEKGLIFVDQLAPMIEVIESGRKAGVLSPTESGPRLIPDGVHPNWAGHLVMATEILKGLSAPSLVSTVTIDAKSGEAKAEKARVSEVKTGEKLSFTRADDAMPWPVPAEAAAASDIPGFKPFDELSRYMLTVNGLSADKYKVSADGHEFGTFTREQLAAGVNLAQGALKGLPEVQELMNAILEKNNLFFNRWRGVQVAELPAWIPAESIESARAAELQKLDAQIAEAEAKVNSLRKPKPHQWVIEPAT